MLEEIYQLAEKNVPRKRAIAYYRHSAEDKQENSIPIQREHTLKFAKQHNIEIIHEEADEGKTGLLANRPGFNNLFQNWIFNSIAPQFDYVLVYDVSRWGRFQNQDEGAHYEFVAKERGKQVVFVSRGFPKEDQQLIAHLQTSIERYMAADYSRQLSSKVFYGCVKVSQDGYSSGGRPCYGMARLLLDANKQPVRVLKKGEHKQIANERITFVPLNDDTTNVVKEIFKLFTEEEIGFSSIVETLNTRGVSSANGKLWNRHKILRILTNEVYVGTRVYNKTWNRLRQGKRNNPQSEWIIRPQSFAPIISRDLFEKTQKRIYWISPSAWKAGVFSIRRAHSIIRSEIFQLLFKNMFPQDDALFIVKKMPIVFSVASPNKNHNLQWCFVIPDEVRNYDFVIGVSIKPNQTKIIDQFFKIPATDLGISNIVMFSKKDEKYSRYKIDSQKLEADFLTLAESIKTKSGHVFKQNPPLPTQA